MESDDNKLNNKQYWTYNLNEKVLVIDIRFQRRRQLPGLQASDLLGFVGVVVAFHMWSLGTDINYQHIFIKTLGP